jgi:hypothetical protein
VSLDVSHVKRWNFGVVNGKVGYCDGLHDKSQPCEYKEMSNGDIIQVITDLAKYSDSH